MNTLMQMGGGPMMLMEGNNTALQSLHQHQPFHPQPSQQPPLLVQQAPITSSMNRSQRCGVCRGCQMKPCGLCTYCQDSPQFGGPGVKKQSCIERRCLRVLENRLQRDAPTFKARVGCNQCEDCRMPDCQICLVCLDKRFFENRYMTGAMCAKKRCNNATSIELPVQTAGQHAAMHEFQQRQAQKRAYEQVASQQSGGPPAGLHFDMKRRAEMAAAYPVSLQMPPQTQQQQQQPPICQLASANTANSSTRILTINPGVNYVVPHRLPMSLPQSHPNGLSLLTTTASTCQIGGGSVDASQTVPPDPITTTSNSNNASVPLLSHQPSLQSCHQPQSHQPMAHALPSQLLSSHGPLPSGPLQMPAAFLVPAYGPHGEYFSHKAFDFVDFHPNGDPFVPPSYAPDMKNAVVLQPL